jgi:hypothetical protein
MTSFFTCSKGYILLGNLGDKSCASHSPNLQLSFEPLSYILSTPYSYTLHRRCPRMLTDTELLIRNRETNENITQ